MGQGGRPSSSKSLGCEYSSEPVLGSASGLLLWELLVPYHLFLTKQDPELYGKPQQGWRQVTAGPAGAPGLLVGEIPSAVPVLSALQDASSTPKHAGSSWGHRCSRGSPTDPPQPVPLLSLLQMILTLLTTRVALSSPEKPSRSRGSS